MSENEVNFAHRANSDGTFDSICRRCFLTVVKSASLSEIAVQEQRHSCMNYWRKESGSGSPIPSARQRLITGLIEESTSRIRMIQYPGPSDYRRTVDEVEQIIQELSHVTHIYQPM
jgi:hypothetical protein